MAKLAMGRGVFSLLLCLAVAGAAYPDEPANAFFAFCMDTHDSRERTLEEQAALLKELGYDGAGHLWLDKVDERLETLDAAGLELFQIYLRVNIAPGAEAYDPRLSEVIPRLKGRNVMLALLVGGGAPSDPEGDARAVAVVGDIAEKASAAGLRVALYPHAGDWLERVEDGLRVVRKVGRENVGVMFNLCHWLKVTKKEEDLRPLLESAMPHLFAVSVHGADKAAAIQAGKGAWIRPLGHGSFDVGALLAMLGELGYTGPVGLQCYGIPGDAREHLTESMSAWRAMRGAR